MSFSRAVVPAQRVTFKSRSSRFLSLAHAKELWLVVFFREIYLQWRADATIRTGAERGEVFDTAVFVSLPLHASDLPTTYVEESATHCSFVT